MAQATLSCRCAAIHLETPLLGFFRNYLPSRFQQFPLFDKLNGRKLYACGRFSYSSSFNTARNASVGTFTEPRLRIRFLPSFCFSSSFFFRVTSPP